MKNPANLYQEGSTESAALFLFAHQDDEAGVFHQIMAELRAGRRVYCIYLTDGGYGGVRPERRNRESLGVLSRLGVRPQEVSFAGEALAIADTKLPEHLESAGRWLRGWLTDHPGTAAIYIPAWEGGHLDHDALHAVLVQVAGQLGLLDRVRQFPLYNGAGCPGRFFRVFKPLAGNGPVENAKIPFRARILFLRLCLSYRSQATTWLGLLPFVFLHYVLTGFQSLQPVSGQRIFQRPHAGPLYYEKRGFYSWERMRDRISAWLKK